VGRGVPQSYAQARQWYRRAAEQGDALAQHNLGRMYAEGQGVPRDDLQAYLWYTLAAAHFSSDADRETAVRNRDLTAQRLTAPQLARAQELARTWRPKPEQPAQRSQQAVLQDDEPTRIRRAQDRLTALGFAPGPVDGVLGPRMRTALQQFQRSQRLPVTGELDDATERALGGR
jgi:TPR repeat protein